jgi:hypothetical protein
MSIEILGLHFGRKFSFPRKKGLLFSRECSIVTKSTSEGIFLALRASKMPSE